MKDNQDSIYDWYNFNINTNDRTLWIGSHDHFDDGSDTGTDYKMAEYTIKGLQYLKSLNDEPIRLIMNNPGGCWYAGMAIYDFIKTLEDIHVVLDVFGDASSRGSIITQAGDTRRMSKHSTMVIHYGTNGFSGHSKDFDRAAEQNKVINKTMENIYLERIREKIPSYSKSRLEGLLRYDRYLSSDEALELGLIDKIL